MRHIFYTGFLLLALALPAGTGQPMPTPAPDVVLPDVVVPLPPTPPKPPPGTPTQLGAEVFYVIQSNAPAIVLGSPDGLVSVLEETGPIRLRGRFVEDPGKVQTKTFAAKQVYIVEAFSKGRCELLVVPGGAKTAANVIRRTLDVLGPGPAPVPPEPGPTPPGPEPPAPIPGGELRVLIVEESADRAKLPAAQQAVLFSPRVRDYLNTNCAVGPDGKTPEWRILDKDTDLSGESAIWQAVMKRPRQSLPWIVIGYGNTGYEGPLPATVDEMLKLLARYTPVKLRKAG